MEKIQTKTSYSPTNLPIVIGWSDINELAENIWCSIHSVLLNGKLLFAYRNNNFQIVLVKNNVNDFAIGMITQGYTMLLPHIPKSFLKESLVDLKNNKIEKTIIDIYNKIIEDLK